MRFNLLHESGEEHGVLEVELEPGEDTASLSYRAEGTSLMVTTMYAWEARKLIEVLEPLASGRDSGA